MKISQLATRLVLSVAPALAVAMAPALAPAPALALAPALASAAPAPASAAPAPASAAPALATAPAASPGTVVSTQPAPDLVAMLGPVAPQATLISYTSTLDNGAPTVTTATVYEPTAPWTGRGPRPTLIVAPGTRGQGDRCAPSRAGLHIASAGHSPSGPFFNAEYEYQTYQLALASGMRVVVPDYIGLGTPGHHSYVNTVEQAHALLDAARAALRFKSLPADSPVGFTGYSQGGGAAASAAEYAAGYAPELNIKGTFAGAPPADLKAVMQAVDGSAISHVLGYALNGFIERDPSIGQAVLPLFNERGRAFLDTAATSCVADSVAQWGLTRTETLTTTGESVSQIMERMPQVSALLERQRLGQHPVTGPIQIANSRADDIIPFAQAKALGGAYCAQGGTVLLTAEPAVEQLTGFGLGHLVPFVGAIPHGIQYMLDRFNDVPAPSNCQ
ncbi:lipase family protein [Corynebacterium phocae]|uniref:lipase family protein n=1 Tax=Corynebacterium phocae TaxID=161895 RepID=UPI002010DD8D|nr:lipase family protein [Corynebacterium phocae]